MLPRVENFQPGIEVEFDIVPGRSSEEKEWNFDRENRRRDGEQRSPQQ
jgi:hypothetical protein